MFSYRYDIKNYEKIVPSFLDFCSFFDEINDVAILSYRYDTWQGATAAIPIDDYKIDENVTDNIYLLMTGVEVADKWNSNREGIDYPSRYSLQNILKHIYPNANIDMFVYSYSSADIMQTIIDRIDTMAQGKLVFSFTDYNPLYSSDSFADIKTFLDRISSKAMSKGLDLYIVYVPTDNTSDDLRNNIESYIYADNPRKVLNFYNILESTRDDLPYALGTNYYVEGNDCRSVWEYANQIVATPVYSRNNLHLFSRFILSEVFKKDREEYYVSMMYCDSPKSKYTRLFTTYDEYMVEEFNYDQYAHGGWNLQGKYGKTIFKNDGKLISIGVHTSFDPYLWMCEQGGITCKKEEDEQIEDLDLMPFYAFLDGSPNKKVKPSVFPTTGCPWFTISSKNISDYGFGSTGSKLYITRVENSFILTLRVIDSNAKRPDVWQSITFGEFIGRQDGYNIDQFYCAGGNQALSPDSWTYYSTSHVIGLQMDLDMKNSSIVNSNILHPSKFEKANLSNFRIMNGEGTWSDIYSATQGYEEYQYLDGNGNATIYTWGVPLTRPNFDINGGNFDTAYPYLSWQSKIDTYTINKYDLKKNNASGKIDPLTVYLSK